MEEIKKRLFMIGFSPESISEVLQDISSTDELELYTVWQEKIYREQCATFVNEVMD